MWSFVDWQYRVGGHLWKQSDFYQVLSLGNPKQVTQFPQIQMEKRGPAPRAAGKMITKLLRRVMYSYCVYFPISTPFLSNPTVISLLTLVFWRNRACPGRWHPPLCQPQWIILRTPLILYLSWLSHSGSLLLLKTLSLLGFCGIPVLFPTSLVLPSQSSLLDFHLFPIFQGH